MSETCPKSRMVDGTSHHWQYLGPLMKEQQCRFCDAVRPVTWQVTTLASGSIRPDRDGPVSGRVHAPDPGRLAEGRCWNCERTVPLRENGEVEYHTTQGAWQCAGTGQLPDTRTDLERAEWWARSLAESNTAYSGRWSKLRDLLAEYDRRGAIVRAAEALVERYDDALYRGAGKQTCVLLDALAAAVRAQEGSPDA